MGRFVDILERGNVLFDICNEHSKNIYILKYSSNEIITIILIYLLQHHAGDFNHLECNLRPKYLDMKEATAEQNSAQYTNLITLPHIVPFMSLFEHISKKPIF